MKVIENYLTYLNEHNYSISKPRLKSIPEKRNIKNKLYEIVVLPVYLENLSSFVKNSKLLNAFNSILVIIKNNTNDDIDLILKRTSYIINGHMMTIGTSDMTVLDINRGVYPEIVIPEKSQHNFFMFQSSKVGYSSDGRTGLSRNILYPLDTGNIVCRIVFKIGNHIIKENFSFIIEEEKKEEEKKNWWQVFKN